MYTYVICIVLHIWRNYLAYWKQGKHFQNSSQFCKCMHVNVNVNVNVKRALNYYADCKATFVVVEKEVSNLNEPNTGV